MTKKVLQFGLLLAILSFSMSAFAQEKPRVQDYPRMGFWSNWSIGADFGYNMQIRNNCPDTYYHGFGGHVFFQKKIHPLWSIRLSLGMPRMNQSDSTGATDNRYGTASIDVLWSIINAFSYNPERKVDLHWLGGFGGAINGRRDNGLGLGTLYFRTGLGLDFFLSEHSTLFIEGILGMNDVPFPTNWVKGGPIQQCNTNIVLGYMYNFGLTKADQELLAQKGALRNDNCDALNDQINDLASELATSKQNERKLENRVNDLENELAMAKKNQNDAANSELQKRIDQMKNDQLTYYALPFSVNYDVNQYTVTDEEQIKLKAIANVMKADSDLKLNIVGFCDATGSDEYNQKLSQKRAETVKNVLVKKYGVDGDRLTCDWKGKTVAFGDGQNAINRRVSFYRMID